MPDLPGNLQNLQGRIAEACARTGRSAGSVTLIAVSKTFPPRSIDEALAAGVRNIGENRVQELRDKIDAVRGTARWHMIGHLQKNKAKDAARLFDVIHTLDSLELAERLDRHAGEAARQLDVLLQVNIGGEAQKSGIGPSSVRALVQSLAQFANLHFGGFMTIPPVADPDQTRRFFRSMRELRDSIDPTLALSMGMSDDFEIAIEEGSTMIRVGRALFGARG